MELDPGRSRVRETRDSIADIWGPRTPYYESWPERVDERLLEEPDAWVQSCCVLCSHGCALDIGVKSGRIVGVRGRRVDRINHGRLGPKGLHGWEANHSPDRLKRPLVRRDGRLVETSWQEAMSLVVARCKSVIREFTPSAVGIYSSGQLFLEEYYTLAVIGKAGIGTPHMDGNTRLCTATAARALVESFGVDGNPGSMRDFDTTEAVLIFGHNMAEQHTVQWMHLLDRRRGPKPPRLIVVDPRLTETAKEADIHLAPRVGTNVALLNGLLHLMIASGWTDRAWIEGHTVNFADLERTVEEYSPARVQEITGVPAEDLRRAAEILGTARSLVSIALQGVYQSHQASAAAVQLNNIHLVRGLVGKAGSTVIQSNGQPTAQNARETGCDGELPGFRNWANEDHVAELARVWNVDPEKIPAWKPPSHAMEIFRYAEAGTIRFLWIVCTNPAVSWPDLNRIRATLERRDTFLVVQDCFPTETTKYADVVLPAAIWGEKTGTFTNTDRTVHISQKAVDPPGEARSDLDIFLEFARRMDFKDRQGGPLVSWHDPESAFEAWKACSKGRPCDYSAMTYEKLLRGSGIQWPCTEAFPEGRERLYEDGRFGTDPAYCTAFGYDLETGASTTADEYEARNPGGRAIIKAAHFEPPTEVTTDDFPLIATTGRVVYQWHTRTKTGRTALQEAAPDVFVQIAPSDAAARGIEEGEVVEVHSARGYVLAAARLGGIVAGHVFLPFHYGSWDRENSPPRAANELTPLTWDPASKQPRFKLSAVQIAKRETYAAPRSGIRDKLRELLSKAPRNVLDALRRPRSHLRDLLSSLRESERCLGEGFEIVAKRRESDPDVREQCSRMARWSAAHVARLEKLASTYGDMESSKPKDLRRALLRDPAPGGFGLLQDLMDLSVLAHSVSDQWTLLGIAARALSDRPLERECQEMTRESHRQLAWLRTRSSTAASQALIVPSR